MRIVCLSDTHCQLKNVKVPDGDVLVHAGDLTYRGTENELRTEMLVLKELPHKHKIIIAGNHDWLFQNDDRYARLLCKMYGLTYLEDEHFAIDKISFWGAPWQPEFGGWAFNLSRMDGSLAEKWELIPEDTDVLITHGPPQGIGDRTPRGAAVGCYDLMERIKALPKLKAHVFGHIHHGYGLYKGVPDFGLQTVFVNASVCNEQYDPVNDPIVIDL